MSDNMNELDGEGSWDAVKNHDKGNNHEIILAPRDATNTNNPQNAVAKDKAKSAYKDLMDEEDNTIFPPNHSDTSANLKVYGKTGQFSTAKGRRAETLANKVK